MIALLQGKVLHLPAPVAVIMTTAGIGYEVELSVPAFCQLQLNEEVQIWTYQHVREDAQLLYGFSTHRDREVFRQLIKINGVGAKMALAMLSNLSVSELKNCVANDEEATLIRIPGIGKKTAQRLLIELKDKLKNIEQLATDEPVAESIASEDKQQQSTIVIETKSALISLGYKEKEAEQAIKLVQKQTENEVQTTQSLLKASLQQLAK